MIIEHFIRKANGKLRLELSFDDNRKWNADNRLRATVYYKTNFPNVSEIIFN